MVVARGWGRGNGELAFNGDRVSLGEDGKVLEMDDGEQVCGVRGCAYEQVCS